MSKGQPKKGMKIILFLLLAAIAAAALFFFTKAKEETETDEMFTMTSNAERVEFLNGQGWVVKPDPISKEDAAVPSVTDSVYAEYAGLQKEQGFDLEKHQGKTVTIFKYQVLNYPDHPDGVEATMLICDGRLIGGDVSLAGEEGFTVPLISAAVRTYLSSDGE